MRNKVFFNSEFHHISSLLQRYPEPLVWIHPNDAKSRGIRERDRVHVSTPRGKVPYTAHITSDILPGVVEVDAHGGGRFDASAWRECNANELTDFENRDPLSGFPVFKALLCQVTKVAAKGQATDPRDAEARDREESR
jgi:anaerobic selenocysteine-containing dehydrogenase